MLRPQLSAGGMQDGSSHSGVESRAAARTNLFLAATLISAEAGHPVKIMMSREEVFKATGPTSGASMTIKIGVKKDGTIVAADGLFKYQAGAFPGSPIRGAAGCAFAPYAIPNVHSLGYDVVSNRSKVAAYRAPGAPNPVLASHDPGDTSAGYG